MKALIAIFSWIMGLANPAPLPADARPQVSGVGNVHDTRGVNIVGANPRTVVALEDTHFRPTR